MSADFDSREIEAQEALAAEVRRRTDEVSALVNVLTSLRFSGSMADPRYLTTVPEVTEWLRVYAELLAERCDVRNARCDELARLKADLRGLGRLMRVAEEG